MARKRLYAKQTAPAEYEQIDLFSLLEEEQRQADRIAEQVRGYEITVGHVAVQRLRARGADYFILGCTELPIIADALPQPGPFVDPTAELAKAAIRICGYKVKGE